MLPGPNLNGLWNQMFDTPAPPESEAEIGILVRLPV